jgi:thioredoxin reductase
VAQKYKVAIVGAGPSGYFAAQALQNSVTKIKTVSKVLIRTESDLAFCGKTKGDESGLFLVDFYKTK